MDTFHIEHDSLLNCMAAKSFPDGVLEAHQSLHKIIPYLTDRKYYGISWPGPDGNIMYKAAAEIFKSDHFNDPVLETFVLKKGDYIFKDIRNYMTDTSSIGKAFRELLKNPDIDPIGECVEWYMTMDAI